MKEVALVVLLAFGGIVASQAVSVVSTQFVWITHNGAPLYSGDTYEYPMARTTIEEYMQIRDFYKQTTPNYGQ